MNYIGIRSLVGTAYSSCRRVLFRSCLEVVKKFIDVYLYFTNKSDNMIQDHSINMGDYKLEKYNIIKNNRNYMIIFASKCDEELQKHILDCKINMAFKLSNKNLIVNCTLQMADASVHQGTLQTAVADSDNNIDVLDITENIRHFCYYFDKDVNIDIFLQHLKFQYDIDYNNYSYLTLYMNDFDFSERKYDLKRLQSLKFSEIFLN